jgi:hypothetical protein
VKYALTLDELRLGGREPGQSATVNREFSEAKEKGPAIARKPLIFLAPEVGLEPTTP